MAEKRSLKRRKKRLKLRFGVEAPKRVAFTEDLSDCGLFIITGQPERPGTRLIIEITMPDEEKVVVRGRVQWAKKVPANLVRVAKKGGMGVRLLAFDLGEDSYRKLIAELRH